MHICNSVGEGGEHDWGLTEVEDGQAEPHDGRHCLGGRREEEEQEEDCSDEGLVVVNGLVSPDVTENGGGEKGFKEMDMDVIGEFRYADEEFKDHDDNLSGPLQRLTTQALSVSGVSGVSGGAVQAGVDGGGEGVVSENLALFQEMCTQRCQDINDIWTDKEKEITFSQDPAKEESKEREGSSSEEEEDGDGGSPFKSNDTNMEVDDWAEVFDRRSSSVTPESSGNPWESAPVSDTTGSGGWADFGSFGSGTAGNNAFANPFQNAEKDKSNFVADFSATFGIPSQENSSNAVFGDTAQSQSTQEEFKADFSSINFGQFGSNCDESKEPAGDGSNSKGDPDNPDPPEKSSEPAKEEEDLMDNFNFLSSRGLMKSGESEGESEGSNQNAGDASQGGDTVTQNQQQQQQQQQQGQESSEGGATPKS